MNYLCLILVVGTVATTVCAAAHADEGAPQPSSASQPFFAMDTGTRDAAHQTPEQQVAMLAELGYAGIGWTAFNELPDLLAALDRHHLALFTIYLGVKIEPDGPEYSKELADNLPLLKGRGTTLWLTITSTTYGVSSPEGDECAVQAVREIAEAAAPYGVRVALYPHVHSWLERVSDAVRVARKVERDNVGATFNLYHWLVTDGADSLDTVLPEAMPFLRLVTINGSARQGTIEPLDSGEFDLSGFLAALKRSGYSGPVGLQGYGIDGDVHSNLTRSMAAWKGLTRR
ncbi:MAG TPA: sugar phosphate isomerase/epimerase family protein [Candidatus Hydrogenedentes bacterium]|nr:sugar phosphate isomerase/epimerase family protein [Candidatus Hydrogenedentota bacterium]HPG67662.1 sugar phosphate isomerase/epimerase family protein [Candidatus Hydrogenedentota bacterium]